MFEVRSLVKDLNFFFWKIILTLQLVWNSYYRVKLYLGLKTTTPKRLVKKYESQKTQHFLFVSKQGFFQKIGTSNLILKLNKNKNCLLIISQETSYKTVMNTECARDCGLRRCSFWAQGNFCYCPNCPKKCCSLLKWSKLTKKNNMV